MTHDPFANAIALPALNSNPLQRYAMGIEFCGTSYRGWQLQQEGVASVQLAVQTALSQVGNHAIEVVAAGRTDAGVHATQMFAHFDSYATRSVNSWLRGCNTLLPKDIALRWLTPVSSQFHARFSAVSRRYQYVLYCHPQRPALLYGKVTHVYFPVDISKMQRAAALLLGTHNFSSFRAAACQSKQPVRFVSRCEISSTGPYIILDIEANGFLHHMVRNIVGCLLVIAKGDKPVEWINDLIQAQDRTQAAPTADADGLYFIHASYPSTLLALATNPISPFNLHSTS